MLNRSLRVAAIHDLSGFGRSSLTVIMPVFAKMGIQVCPLPTALLSTHGAYEGGTFLDLTDQMEPIMNHWEMLGVDFDAIYPGFLGSGNQIDHVIDFIKRFSSNKPLVVLDPVMGDEGKVYSIIDNSIAHKMVELVKHAHIITPNTTEAFVLLNREYKPEMDEDEAISVMKDLAALGPKTVILTSIHGKGEEGRYTGIYDSDSKEVIFDRCEYVPRDYPGTGDAFTTVFIGAQLKGYNLKDSLRISLQFIEDSLKSTIESGVDPRDGINLEIPEVKFPR